MATKKSLGVTGPVAVLGALFATLSVRWLGLALVDVPPEFPPLDGPGPTVFFTVVSGLVAVGVFAAIRRFSRDPVRLFRRIAIGVLVLSFLPDLGLLGAGAAATFPGATPAGVGLLMLMHVAAAVVIVWALTAWNGAGKEG